MLKTWYLGHNRKRNKPFSKKSIKSLFFSFFEMTRNVNNWTETRKWKRIVKKNIQERIYSKYVRAITRFVKIRSQQYVYSSQFWFWRDIKPFISPIPDQDTYSNCLIWLVFNAPFCWGGCGNRRYYRDYATENTAIQIKNSENTAMQKC